MPGFPSLLPAIGLLQAAGEVRVSTWTPAAGSGPGLGGGAWSTPTKLPKPYTVDTPTGSKALIQIAGGETVTADLVVYCPASAVSVPAPGGRWPRVTFQGQRYRVLGLRSTAGLPAAKPHVGMVCALDNGGE